MMQKSSGSANGMAMIIGFGVFVAGVGMVEAGAPPATRSTTQQSLSREVEQVLTRLEARTVETLHANVTWKQRYVLEEEEDALIKLGELWYRDAEPVAQFLIHFTRKIGAGGRSFNLDERHLFDGRWYVEVQGVTKSITRREVRRPDDRTDPYKLGEGVFPLPFGQARENILREFEVELIEPAETDPAGTDHLRLRPREKTQSFEHYRELDFWIAQKGPLAGLPLKVRGAKKKGTGQIDSFITITFRDVALNEKIGDERFVIETPAGFQEMVERLGPAADPQEGGEE